MLDGRAEIERPGVDSVLVHGVHVRAGSRVVLHPRSTSQDILMRGLDGKRAIVENVMQDLEDNVSVTVSLDDDPARALGPKARGLGHRFFFAPEEIEPLADAPRRILVAGIGNVFLGDDGFGVEVARRLGERDLPEGVDVADFGIRGMDLAYALVDGYDAALLVDASPLGQAPGTIEVIEPEIDPNLFSGFEGHGLDPVGVLHFAQNFGSLPARTLVVACEPAELGDPEGQDVHAQLSAPVAAAVDTTIDLVVELIEEFLDEGGDE